MELVGPEAEGRKRYEVSPPSGVTEGMGGVCESQLRACGPPTARKGECFEMSQLPSAERAAVFNSFVLCRLRPFGRAEEISVVVRSRPCSVRLLGTEILCRYLEV